MDEIPPDNQSGFAPAGSRSDKQDRRKYIWKRRRVRFPVVCCGARSPELPVGKRGFDPNPLVPCTMYTKDEPEKSLLQRFQCMNQIHLIRKSDSIYCDGLEIPEMRVNQTDPYTLRMLWRSRHSLEDQFCCSETASFISMKSYWNDWNRLLMRSMIVEKERSNGIDRSFVIILTIKKAKKVTNKP